NANVVDISEKIIKEMSKIESDYPQVSLNMLTDTASYITSAVNNITTTAVQAAVIAVLVVFVFLRSPKMALIVGVSIPTSIIATFAAMWLSGMTMNMISMGGVAIGIGMLVDNSIVVLENIFSYMKKGYDEREAAAKGANEVAMAVTASTLTTMGVFVPLLFISGTMGDVFKDLSLTICFALIASLAVSLTFVPMACSQLIKKEQVMEEMLENRPKTLGSRFLHLWGRGLDKLESGYTKLLSKCLVNKKKVVVLVIIIFIATLSLVPRMGFDFMPEMDEGVVAVSVSLPNGTVLEETELVVEQVMGILSDYEEVDMYYATIGGSGFMGGSADSASITLNLVDKTEREHSSKEIARLMENDLSRVAGCEITVAASSSAMGSYGGSGITVTLTGDESDILRSI
ncbi:MAG: efflux RND transporter permease subunit, partial [Anaerotignaceae bacterium]